jgi:integrase
MSPRTRLTDVLVRSCQPTPREYALHDSVLRGFALRVRPSGAKTWILRTRQGGRPQRIALGDASAIAAEIARQRAHALLSGSSLPAELVRPPAMSLKKFAELYLERKLKDWRPSTRRTHQSYLANQLLPALGHRPLDRISVPEVAEWFHTYSRTRPGGANRAVAVLSDLFSRAIEWGLLPQDHSNPCFAIRRNRNRVRGQMLNRDALARLGAALDKYALIRPDAVDAIRLLLLTGARPGEIFGLQWQEVEGGRIVLSQAKRGPRSIQLGKSAAQILNARRRHRATSRFVFPHRTLPDHPMSLPAATTWRVLKREAILPATLRLHDLRHNFASHALLSGESLLVAGSLLGHSRPAMTARYTHLTDDCLLNAAQRIASSIANSCGQECPHIRQDK